MGIISHIKLEVDICKVETYSNAYVLEEEAIGEPHDSTQGEEKRKREWHKLYTLCSNNLSLHVKATHKIKCNSINY